MTYTQHEAEKIAKETGFTNTNSKQENEKHKANCLYTGKFRKKIIQKNSIIDQNINLHSPTFQRLPEKKDKKKEGGSRLAQCKYLYLGSVSIYTCTAQVFILGLRKFKYLHCVSL